jgi:alcohol dehydrogenase
MKTFTFHNPGKIICGNGYAKTAGLELAALKATRALLITDPWMGASETAAKVQKNLGQFLGPVFAEVEQDSSIALVDRALALAHREGADAVVSLGGGSVIDTGKAVAAGIGAGVESIRGLMGYYTLKKKPAPHVTIPTTAGTGSECTSMALIRDREARKKIVLVDTKLFADVGILDPVVTLSLPPALTAATGMDAFCHAAESLMSENANPLTDGICVHSLGLIHQTLPHVIERGDDLEARAKMLVASCAGGLVIQNAFVGIVHAMAHSLGGLYGVPHGVANGMLLWVGMEYNSKTVPKKVAAIGRALGVEKGLDPFEDAAWAVEAVRAFAKKVGIPERLTDIGVTSVQLAELAAATLSEGSLVSNPRKPQGADEIIELFEKIL